jgi:hypothetical protein
MNTENKSHIDTILKARRRQWIESLGTEELGYLSIWMGKIQAIENAIQEEIEKVEGERKKAEASLEVKANDVENQKKYILFVKILFTILGFACFISFLANCT